MRFSAFKQRTTPEVLGHVERVSPDAFLNEETRETYYVVRIRVSEEELAKLGAVKIRPGMPVDIMIRGGERTAMQYLSDPLMEIIEKGIGGRIDMRCHTVGLMGSLGCGCFGGVGRRRRRSGSLYTVPGLRRVRWTRDARIQAAQSRIQRGAWRSGRRY